LLLRVLLDENLPLESAAPICDVFVTMDRNLPYQQNMPALSFGVIVVYAHSNRLTDLRPIVPELLAAIRTATAGTWVRVGV